MQVKGPSQSQSKNTAIVDLLLIFIPTWVLIFSREAINSEWVSNLGRLAVIVFTLWLINHRGNGLRNLGVKRPEKVLKIIGLGFGLMLLGIIVAGAAQEFLISLPGIPLPESDLSRFSSLEGNLPVLFFWLVTVWTTVAFGEELIWRAFLLDRLGTLFGKGVLQNSVVVLLSAALFGLAHFYQGTMGMITAGILGGLYVLAYRKLGRNLWVVFIAHGLTDTLSIISTYSGRM